MLNLGRTLTQRTLAVFATGMGMLAVAPPLLATERVCVIARDCSASLDESARLQACAKVERTLDSFLAESRCTVLVLSCFADEGAFAPREVVPVPPRPEPMDCSKAEPNPETRPKSLFDYFENYRSFVKEQAAETCRSDNQRATEEWQRGRTLLHERVHEALAAPTASAEHGSSISAALNSLLTGSPAVVLVVTDGLEKPLLREPIQVSKGTRVVMLLVPPRSPYGTPTETIAVAPLWRQRVPGLSILFLPELNERTWRDLAGGQLP